MLNTNKLKAKMKEKAITQKDVAKALDISTCAFNLKINNKRPLFLEEADKLCIILSISDDEFRNYFFVS